MPFAGTPSVRGYTPAQRMAALTFCLVGLQFTWGVEMTYFTPHLLALGLAKSQTSLVWIAPPLSGLIVQPIIGSISDHSTLRWGRRRPYMFGCAAAVAGFLCLLGWAEEVVGGMVGKGDGNAGVQRQRLTAALAIFCIYAVDFAINAVQATARSLIVDTLPVSEQQLGSAWAGRMLGLGHVLGYFAGTLDLHAIFGNALGSSQFKQICVIASTTIVCCVGVTCLCVKERVLLGASSEDADKTGTWKEFVNIVKTTLHLPRRIRAVCWITFWSWIGWSPFFVYGTTWVGETYYRASPSRAAELRNSTDVVGDIARRGSIALVFFSIISLAGSIFLPFVVSSPTDASDDPDDEASSTKAVPKRFATLAKTLRPYQPDITTAWALSQVAFGTSMILAPISHSFQFATILIALCGIPWAMYGWAPLAIMGEEINKLDRPSSDQAYTFVGHDGPVETDRLSLDSTQLLASHPTTPSFAANNDPDETNATGDMAGVYLGIWNIFATVPQFIATFIAMIAFSILEPGRSPELSDGDGTGDGQGEWKAQGLSGTAVCLAVGAVCSFVAAARTWGLRKL